MSLAVGRVVENGVHEVTAHVEKMDHWIVWECEKRAVDETVSFPFFL